MDYVTGMFWLVYIYSFIYYCNARAQYKMRRMKVTNSSTESYRLREAGIEGHFIMPF
jgi:hypothetical protein